ncbi:MAG: four helix bundle protein [Bacteroidales bacterium]|nr:four helix bundle protein [Bacteroidales bacterium]
MEEKNFSFFRFEDLRIYHKALDFATFVYQNTAAFPEDLKRDFLDASSNIVLSIAQGSFYGKVQFINILKEVRNAIRSCVVYTAIGQRIGAFTDAQSEESTIHLQELSKMLGAFIGSLKKQTGHSHSDEMSTDTLEID